MNNWKKGDYSVTFVNEHLTEGYQVIYTDKKIVYVAAQEITLFAGAKDNVISLASSSSYDVIHGDSGNDFIGTSGSTKYPTIYGGDGNDTIRMYGIEAAPLICYAEGGDGDDLFIPLASTNVTLAGGEGNDTFWFIESTNASISGGDGNDLYYFDPYDLFGPYHNDVVITDISSNDTIKYNYDISDSSELSWYNDSDGNVVLEDAHSHNFTITLQGVNDIKEVANVTYRSMNGGSKTLGELFLNTWSISGTTATYGTNKKTVATITGLKSGLKVVNGEIDGIYANEDNAVITLSANVLGTGTVKVTGGYTLAPGDDVPWPEPTEPEWKVSGTTATLSNSTTAGYTLSNDERTITYTPAKSGAALVTITGLKSGLKAEDGYIKGIDVEDDTIYLSTNVLGTTTVKVSGDYYLAFDEVCIPYPEPTDPVWTVSGTTATLRQGTTEGYTLSDDGQSITYTPAQSGAAIATITGLKRGLSEDELNDGTYVDSDSKEITLTSDVLGTTNVSITGDYTLALGDDVYPPEPTEPEWTISGTTATLRQSTTEGYTLSDDGQSITYTAKATNKPIAVVSGLKKGLTIDDLTAGIEYDTDSEQITLYADVLGTTTVKVSGDYYLALGDDVYPPEPGEPEWTVSGTTATLSNSTTEGYTLSDDEKSITYTAAKAGKAIATVSGLAKGLTAEDGYIDGIDVEDNVITLTADVLGTTKITVKGDYTLALGDDVPEPEEVEDAWTIKGTTATLSDGTTAGYTLSNDERTITYTAAKAGKAKATVSGLAKGLTANVDGKVDSIDFDGETITLSADALGTGKVTLKGDDYVLELGEDVERAEPSDEPKWKVSGTKATLNITTSAGYACDGKTITYSKKETTSAVATISGLKKGTTADDLDFDGETITLSAEALGTSKVTLKGTGYALAPGDDVPEPEEVEDAWTIKGTTATLSDGTTAGYTLSNDERTITYTAAKAGKAKATISGLAKGLTANVDGKVDGIELDGETITLSADALGTGKVTLKGDDYVLELGEDVERAEPSDEPEWNVSGTKATLNITTSAGYACDGKTITYSKKETTSAVATISGLKKGTTADDLDFDGETITLSAEALGTSKVTLKGTGYALAPGDDVDLVVYDDYDWTFNAKKQTATLKGNATAGYSCDGSTVTYTAAKKNVTIATITGVTDVDGLDFDGETVTLSGDSLTDKVSVSGNVAFEFGEDFNDGTITGSKAADIITVNGTGVTINAGKGDDYLTSGNGGNTFLYASGDGDDVIANFTEDDRIKVTSGTPKVTADDSDIKVTVGKGTITLSEAAGQTVYLLDKKDNETEHNPYWFIDDDFETTPQLADITAEVNSMLGEMDIATDPTQLVQMTPIVTTSDKK